MTNYLFTTTELSAIMLFCPELICLCVLGSFQLQCPFYIFPLYSIVDTTRWERYTMTADEALIWENEFLYVYWLPLFIFVHGLGHCQLGLGAKSLR